ncbi:MAG TPA: diacylglycerol kinase family protein [Pirellulaceae bacterium]|nr:diacylglycerol kinase family protein [Pirellulaceae bacterium]HMO92995.1 diacylglycerol kinase family protein [Pirellulaceae bacterium]HMP67927.1 diacylglycerol kinase family protein [Pirellulaceae bacterium]
MDENNPHFSFIRLNRQLDQVIILYNPRAGASTQSKSIDNLVCALTDQGFDVSAFADVNEARRVAELAEAQNRLRTIVVAGGDGTATLAANHFDPRIPLTLFPLGTENLLSKYLWLRQDAGMIAGVVREGLSAKLDAAEANGNLFLIMASCGFDADVVHRLHRQRTGNITHLSYLKPIFNSLRNYRYPTLRIRCLDQSGDQESPISAKWAFCFNIPQYAMQLPIVETANATDGKLDICTFRRGNLLNGLIYFFGVLFRTHRRFRDTKVIQAEHVLIESDKQVPYQIDGDPGGYLPLEIRALRRRLNVLVPLAWANANGYSQEANNELVST